MGWKDITAGEKIAKAQGARFIKSESGALGMEVSFRFEEPSTKNFETLNWVAWFGRKQKSGESVEEHNEKMDKLKKDSMETLVNVLGYNGSQECNGEGILQGNIFSDKEVSLKVEMEKGLKDPSKSYPKIRFVNNIGGSSYAGVTPAMIKSDLQRSGFSALFVTTMKSSGKDVKTPPPGQQNKTTPPPANTQAAPPQEDEQLPGFSDDDIPF